MRKGRFFSKDFYLTERQWSQLVGRFDVDKAKEHTDTFKIKVRCFCDGIPCSKCPLGKFQIPGYNGCGRAISAVLGRVHWAFMICMDEIYWWKEDDKKARKQVQKVYDYLSNMKWVSFKDSG